MFNEKTNTSFIFSFDSWCEANDFDNIYQSVDLAPLRTNNTFSQPFRILKTKISDAALFDAKYGNTDLSIGYVLSIIFILELI